MKKHLSFCCFLLMIPLLVTRCGSSAPGSNSADHKGTITVTGAWALYPMMTRWGEEYQKIHPQVKLDISAGGAGKGMTDVLAGIADSGAGFHGRSEYL